MQSNSTLFVPQAQRTGGAVPGPVAMDLIQRIAQRNAGPQAGLARALDRLTHADRSQFVTQSNHAAAQMLQALDFLRQHPQRSPAWGEAPFNLSARELSGAAATLVGAGLEGLGLLERHDETTLQRMAVATWRTLAAKPLGTAQLPVHLAPLVRVFDALAAGTHELVPGAPRASMRYLNAALLAGGAVGLRLATEALTADAELKLQLRALVTRPAEPAAAPAAPATAAARACVAPAGASYVVGSGTYGGWSGAAGLSAAPASGRPTLQTRQPAPASAAAAVLRAPGPPWSFARAPVHRSLSLSEGRGLSPTQQGSALIAPAAAPGQPVATQAAPAPATAGQKRRASEGEDPRVQAKRARPAPLVTTHPSSPAPTESGATLLSPESMSAPSSRDGAASPPYAEIRALLSQALPPRPASAAAPTAQVGVEGLGSLEVPTTWMGAMLRKQPPNAAAADWRTVGFAGLKLEMTLAGLHTLVHDKAPGATTAVRSFPGQVSLPVPALRQLIASPAMAQLGHDPVRVVVDGLGATLPLSQLATLLGHDADAAA